MSLYFLQEPYAKLAIFSLTVILSTDFKMMESEIWIEISSKFVPSMNQALAYETWDGMCMPSHTHLKIEIPDI